VAADLGAQGWDVEELVLMARSPSPPLGAAADRVERVAQVEVHELWDRSWRRELPVPPDRLDAVVEQLVRRERLDDLVVAVTDLVVREDDVVVAAAQLRVDGATAALESVMTHPAHRGRGHADALLARALELAGAAGCDLVVLEAAADDWPRHWYARRGFAEVGRTWAVTRPA
jgi:GNAT superfamily N-acetyltransferase